METVQQIPLRNKEHAIVGYATVSASDADMVITVFMRMHPGPRVFLGDTQL
jgi:hypothetical protein